MKSMNWRFGPGRIAVAVALGALLVTPVPGLAQGDMPGRRGRAELEQRVRARFGQMIRERLNLTDEQAQRLGQVVERFQDDRRELARNEASVRHRIQALLLETNPSEQDARSLLDTMSVLREREVRLSAREEDSLLTVLSPSQTLGFNVLREEMGARIRQLRRSGGPPVRGSRGGGPPPDGGGAHPGDGFPGGSGLPDGTFPAPQGSF